METLRVLVVDDEPGMRLGVARALRGHVVTVPEIGEQVSLRVDQAETGERALDVIRADAPDILLLDYKLPGIDGLDVLKQIDGQRGPMATVMMTAYASLDTAISAIKKGAFDFLAKPFTPDELKVVVEKAAANIILARQARKLAREKRQARFEFISVLAHELKAPLNAIEGYLTTIRDRSAGDDETVYGEMLDRALVRLEGMRKMIFDLLDLTRIESGRRKRELTALDVGEVAAVSVETFAAEAARQGVTFALDADKGTVLTADRGEVEVIFNNLISNAIKYNREGGKVVVSLRGGDGDVTIRVRDTGIGMTEEESSRLFEDFVRIKNDKTRDILGSGLGLSIVRKLAHMYGGRVTAESAPDVGSTFSVVLKSAQAVEGSDDGSK